MAKGVLTLNRSQLSAKPSGKITAGILPFKPVVKDMEKRPEPKPYYPKPIYPKPEVILPPAKPVYPPEVILPPAKPELKKAIEGEKLTIIDRFFRWLNKILGYEGS